MNDTFREDGHITDQALTALALGKHTDELTRLELAEHLSFCDRCLDAYMAVLSDDRLLDPPAPQAQSIIRRAKQRARLLFFNRYTRAAVAACLAIGLWSMGIFSPDLVARHDRLFTNIGGGAAAITAQVKQWHSDVSSSLSDLLRFDGFPSNNNPKGASSNEKE